MLIKTFYTAGLLVLGSTIGASAGPSPMFYESINSSTTPGLAFSGLNFAAANSFRMGTATNLSEVEIALQRTSTFASTGSVIITMNADNGLAGALDAPGAVLYTLYTLTDVSLGAASKKDLLDITNMGIVGLNSGTTYWIDMVRVGTVASKISVYTDASAPTVPAGTNASDYYYTNQVAAAITSVASTGPEIQMCLSSDNSCGSANTGFITNGTIFTTSQPSVPEPATLAILGSGFLGVGWFRHRAKARIPTA